MDLIGKTFVVDAFDFEKRDTVEKTVKVVDILDGPGSDKRDYVTLEGYYDWEVDLPLENLFKMIK